GDPYFDWPTEVHELNTEYPVVVFSKTYCPYSKRTKALLSTMYELTPPPKIIEVDLRSDGAQLKQLLGRLTNHSTFPNILVQGKSVGGSDDLHALHYRGELTAILQAAGVTV
ncbi:glutaredoxin, partial [Fistulina hepatica ATCC 64428]